MIARPHQREFEKFVRDSSTRLTRTAFLLCGDRGAAEDLVQVALTRTARRWRTARQHPEAYARRVVVNLVRDRWRDLARRPAEVFVEVEVAVSEEPDNPWLEHVAEAVDALSLEQRSVIVLRYVEGLSIEETALALDCTPSAVKSRAHRGLTSLRSVLEQQLEAQGTPGFRSISRVDPTRSAPPTKESNHAD